MCLLRRQSRSSTKKIYDIRNIVRFKEIVRQCFKIVQRWCETCCMRDVRLCSGVLLFRGENGAVLRRRSWYSQECFQLRASLFPLLIKARAFGKLKPHRGMDRERERENNDLSVGGLCLQLSVCVCVSCYGGRKHPDGEKEAGETKSFLSLSSLSPCCLHNISLFIWLLLQIPWSITV